MEEVFHKWLVYIQVMIGVLYWLENKVINLGKSNFGISLKIPVVPWTPLLHFIFDVCTLCYIAGSAVHPQK